MNLPIAREFVGGPWHGDTGCLAEHDRYIRGSGHVRSMVDLDIGGASVQVPVFSQVHFIYELDSDGDMVCLVAGTRDDCEMAIARKLADE